MIRALLILSVFVALTMVRPLIFELCHVMKCISDKISEMTAAINLIERMHYKRRSSFILVEKNRRERTLAEQEHQKVPRRQKSISVCVSSIPDMASEYQSSCTTINGVEKNAFPQTLNAFELQTMRPTLDYVDYPRRKYFMRHQALYQKPQSQTSFIEYIKKRRHTVCAWTFGIVAVTLMTIVIVMQTKRE
uniref:G_PROTEIN_RECEP_F1_2 domain-containing protein n=1 Tax=Heterorhabditis bacteriophora TaxID=37862 RepID=A0A1I7XLP1_HETBA